MLSYILPLNESMAAQAAIDSLTAELKLLRAQVRQNARYSFPYELKALKGDEIVDVSAGAEAEPLESLDSVPHCSSNPIRRQVGAPALCREVLDLELERGFQAVRHLNRGTQYEYVNLATSTSYLFDVFAALHLQVRDPELGAEPRGSFGILLTHLQAILQFQLERLDFLKLLGHSSDVGPGGITAIEQTLRSSALPIVTDRIKEALSAFQERKIKEGLKQGAALAAQSGPGAPQPSSGGAGRGRGRGGRRGGRGGRQGRGGRGEEEATSV